MDPEVHRLLLARLDEIERYSMDDLARPMTMVPNWRIDNRGGAVTPSAATEQLQS